MAHRAGLANQGNPEQIPFVPFARLLRGLRTHARLMQTSLAYTP